MEKKLTYLLFVVFSALIIYGCKLATDPEESKPLTGSGTVRLKGQVIDATTNSPLSYASVKVINGTDELTALSDSLGYYDTIINIDAAKEIKLIASKEGYRADTTSAQVSGGNSVEIPIFKLHVQNYSILKGIVVDNNTGNALSSAVIRVVIGSNEIQTITDDKGQYLATTPIDKNKDVKVIAIKEGYYADTLSVFATLGRTIDVPLFKLKIRNSTNVQSGNPASIFLVSQNNQSIGIKESGSVETATLVWEVQDSAGVPVDLQHSAVISFKVGVTPGGGEYVSPAVAATNALGRVILNVSSGTKAGVMQLIAEIQTPGKVIRSKPVSIAIHGGLPDQKHFSIAPEKFNIPGYNINGVIDNITAYCGDKYSNPVKTGTAVSFTTEGGYIEGSALTNEMGLATVRLISANPRPVHPYLGYGFATIIGKTANENYEYVSDTTIVLFSGLPYLTISPTSVNIPHLGTQTFNYELKDQNGNPLSSGTNISVTVEGDNLKTAGDLSVNLPDTQSKSWTQFSFTVTSKDTSSIARPVTIKILSSGPNGSAKLNLSGVAR
ncbi:MAG: hypothetical protein Q8940_20585 [Bacteroidota bacterium]|nr:hypothetical protein [Bacteroidota bacterium]